MHLLGGLLIIAESGSRPYPVASGAGLLQPAVLNLKMIAHEIYGSSEQRFRITFQPFRAAAAARTMFATSSASTLSSEILID